MFLRRFTDFVLQSRVQAMATAFVIAFMPIIGSIGILIAALVTLRKGIIEGALVTLAATLPYLISYFTWAPGADQAQTELMMLSMIVISNLLTWVLAIVLLRVSNWSFTLELAALIGILAITMIHLFYPDIQNWWGKQLTTYFANLANVVDKASSQSGVPVSVTDIQQQTIAAGKLYATGFVTVSVLFNALLQLVVARWWQAAMFNPGGLRKELYQIRLGHIAGLIFVVGIVAAYIGNDMALDMMPVLYTIFFVAGLSLFHSLAASTKKGWMWLLLIYAGIIWLFPLSIIVVSIIALFDTGIDFRKRFNFKR